MKYFLDTEFYDDDDSKIIDLISIGVVSEDGRRFYACNNRARLDLVSNWLRVNVLPKLPSFSAPMTGVWMSPLDIAQGLERFVKGDAPEFWAYYADYDWVAVCQLFGGMLHLPPGWPKYCLDLKQWMYMLGNPKVGKLDEAEQHDALGDAMWNRDLYYTLKRIDELERQKAKPFIFYEEK